MTQKRWQLVEWKGTAPKLRRKIKEMKTDILIVGSGCAGLYCALNFPEDKI